MIGYTALHHRIKAAFGPASSHQCARCTRQAQEWAYDHSDPEPLIENGKPYSLDITKYVPLCRPCHRAQDGQGVCRKGHPWTEESTYTYRGYRLCKICRRENLRRFREKERNRG